MAPPEERPPFTCEVPPPPTAPSSFLAMSYFDGLANAMAHQVVRATTADGVTDTLWTYPQTGLNQTYDATYHPDRGGVLSAREDVGDGDQWVLRFVRPDGSTSVYTPPDGAVAWAPRWRPDGERVLVGWYPGDGTAELAELDPETGRVERLAPAPQGVSRNQLPAYAPGGRHLAYVAPYRSSTGAEAELRVVDLADGTTSVPGADEGVRLYNGAYGPVEWSPDGAWLASRGERTVSADSSYYGVFAARADGSAFVEIAVDSAAARSEVGWVSAGCLVVLDREFRVHLVDLHGNSRLLSEEPVPPTSRQSTSFTRGLPSRYSLVPGGGRMVAVIDDPAIPTTMAVVDLAPFAVREVALGPPSAYRIADWVES